MKTYTVTLENRKTGNEKIVTVEAADKFEAMAKAENKGWAAVDSRPSPGSLAMQPAIKATMKHIEQVAAAQGIDLQAEMRKSEAVERTLVELRRWSKLTASEKVAEFEGYDQ